MTPSQQAKAAGLKSLTQVKDLTGISLNTLTNWHRDRPQLFEVVIEGCISKLQYLAYKAASVPDTAH